MGLPEGAVQGEREAWQSAQYDSQYHIQKCKAVERTAARPSRFENSSLSGYTPIRTDCDTGEKTSAEDW